MNARTVNTTDITNLTEDELDVLIGADEKKVISLDFGTQKSSRAHNEFVKTIWRAVQASFPDHRVNLTAYDATVKHYDCKIVKARVQDIAKLEEIIAANI